MMPDLARLSFESAGDIELARVAGEVDASNVESLSKRLLEGISNRAGGLVIDLTETTYIDSSGISLIFDAVARFKNRRQKLRLVVQPSSFVSEVLSAVAIEETVPVDSEVNEALKAVEGGD